MQLYTPKSLEALDRAIVEAEAAHTAALLSMGSAADADNNTWHDNAAFDYAKQEVERTRIKLRELKSLREDAVLKEGASSDLIEVGSSAIIQLADDELMRVHIAGHQVMGRDGESGIFDLSTTSPLGAALLGLRVDESAEYSTPSGRKMQVRVVEIL